MKKILSFSLFFFLGCSTSKVNLHPDRQHENLFPQGIYRHQVTLSLSPMNKDYEFDGVVKLSPEEITIVVLSFFGTTEFKIHEDLRDNQIQVEIYHEEFKKYEPKLREYYSTLKLILLAKKSKENSGSLIWEKQNSQGEPLEMKSTINGEAVHFYLGDYDKNEIPGKLKIEGGHFSVKVKVISYEI